MRNFEATCDTHVIKWTLKYCKYIMNRKFVSCLKNKFSNTMRNFSDACDKQQKRKLKHYNSF